MTRREVIPASEEHERKFRESFELRAELKGNPEWEMAFEHAARYKLYPDEIAAIGSAIVRKAAVDEMEKQ